ncbi:MAG TPA: glycosyltransferase 87 family protein, partial [Acidimicrobiales bacterium]|nr:glycosyltransferase 87 family protein [Acidimicrobiales bacterium]
MSADAVRRVKRRMVARMARWTPEEGDAVLYATSALFAGVTARFSGLALYRQWGMLAVGPYLVAAVVSAIVGRRRARAEAVGDRPAGAQRSWNPLRVAVLLFVLFGATLGPLCLEVAWGHAQPEALTVEQAGTRLANGQDPYQLPVRDGRVLPVKPGQPVYESYFPYLPVMTVFGLPASTKEPVRLTDARIFFTLVTLVVVAGALALYRGPDERRVRTLQVLTVLPTAALPLATGGDDMPVLAFLLLAMVLAQRRRPGWSGFVLGIVCAMKFTAWPLAALALFAARTRDGRRAPGRMALGMLVVLGPVVVPFLARNPHDFIENVILYPLGLARVSSPATSPLPGHLLVSAVPALHRIV